jgi:prophage regulatory protein
MARTGPPNTHKKKRGRKTRGAGKQFLKQIETEKRKALTGAFLFLYLPNHAGTFRFLLRITDMVSQVKTALCILRRNQVQARTGLSRSTIYLRIAEGSFPKPVSLGARAVGWLESDIEQWLTSRVEESRGAVGHAA